ncbi:MAG: DEAD/DEAH box helicase [Phycisphaerales bacterium]|nr:DEAD/DEAH box helicase [Phycisphaerales bacterium]
MLHFSDIELAKPILRAVKDEGYDTPTPIQAQAIPSIMQERDVLGSAQTGTGKTAAFALPVLHLLHTQPIDKSRRGPMKPRALVLSPTRELATQIGDSFATYGRHTNLRHTAIFGGVSQHHQVKALQRGVDVIVATPGRLMDLMEQRLVDLTDVGIFVLDEADRMLDMGFIHPIRRIAAALPEKRQTLLFSATMPASIKHLADSLLNDPVRVTVKPEKANTPKIEQSLYLADKAVKPVLLEHLLHTSKVELALVFTRTKFGADKLTRKLGRSGFRAVAIHGNKSQNQRQRALNAFRSGRSPILVATDVAARGIDVDGVSHVFNFDLPNEAEAYVHRIGRTGRAGMAGVAISFCARDERGYLRDIEKLIGKRINQTKVPDELHAIAQSESHEHDEDNWEAETQQPQRSRSDNPQRPSTNKKRIRSRSARRNPSEPNETQAKQRPSRRKRAPQSRGNDHPLGGGSNSVNARRRTAKKLHRGNRASSAR